MTSAQLLHSIRSAAIKSIADELGFLDCKIAKAEQLIAEGALLEDWLSKGFHGEMKYMENYFNLRTDPLALVPGAKSVIVLSQNYYPSAELVNSSLKISKYAYGDDYHDAIRAKMKEFLMRIRQTFGEVNGRGFVDSAPVMEKAWAQRAGLGWMGKHTNIITKKRGSFFFLAVLIVDLELASDSSEQDHCGACTRCIEACPTEAIVAPYLLNASKCISYFTIELRSAQLPKQHQGQFRNWIFGCDICQDVCPWNRFSKPSAQAEFQPGQALLEMKDEDWQQLKIETFEFMFSKSAIKRTGFDGLKRNIQFVANDRESSDTH